MHDRLALILSQISRHNLASVAAGAIGVGTVADLGPVAYEEITTPHADERTIGIVRVSGAIGSAVTWSSVVKILDLSIAPGPLSKWTSPENEETVYERSYFAGDELRFRPAQCFGTSHISESVKLIWLEDLTRAKSAPFEIEDLARIERHLGEWNGVHAARPPSLAFPLPTDSYLRRWRESRLEQRLEVFQTLSEDELAIMYSDVAPEIASELYQLVSRLNVRAQAVPHGLAFGDAAIGNLFSLPDETVAVDWASLTSDPVGADGGISVGSAITWGRGFAEVAERERELFDCYLEGLRVSGWTEPREDIRRGYFGQFGYYLVTLALLPAMQRLGSTPGSGILPKATLEKRFQMPFEDIQPAAARLVRLFPAYVEEIRGLLE